MTPMYKKGEKSYPANSRPVSLTSVVCKTTEHIFAEDLRVNEKRLSSCLSLRSLEQTNPMYCECSFTRDIQDAIG